MAVMVERDELCDRECLRCTNADAKLCRKWAWLLDSQDARVAVPLVEGRHCGACGHAIALKTFKYCPYCGTPIERTG